MRMWFGAYVACVALASAAVAVAAAGHGLGRMNHPDRHYRPPSAAPRSYDAVPAVDEAH